MDVSNLIAGVIGGGFVTTVGGLSLFVFRTAIGHALNRSVLRDIEDKKHALLTQFENHKHELDIMKHQIQHSLQRDVIKAEIQANKINEIYPQIFEKISIAHGTVANLIGFRFATNWEAYSTDEIKLHLEERHVPELKRQSLVNRIVIDRKEGLGELRRFLKELEIDEARFVLTEAKNLLVLKSLYLNVEIRKLAHEIVKKIFSALVDIEFGKEIAGSYKKAQETINVVAVDLEAFEEKMRSDLSPK